MLAARCRLIDAVTCSHSAAWSDSGPAGTLMLIVSGTLRRSLAPCRCRADLSSNDWRATMPGAHRLAVSRSITWAAALYLQIGADASRSCFSSSHNDLSNQPGLCPLPNTAISIRGLHKPYQARLCKRYIRPLIRSTVYLGTFLHAGWRMPAVVEANHIKDGYGVHIQQNLAPQKSCFLGLQPTPALGVSREKGCPAVLQPGSNPHRPVE